MALGDKKQQNAPENGTLLLEKQHSYTLDRLREKGLCRRTGGGYHLFSDLFASYLADTEGRGRGRIWLAEETGDLFQGETLLVNLAPLERAVLDFLVRHPRVRHTKTDLTVNAWPEELRRDKGISDDSLYHVVAGLRKIIEPNPAKPCYIVTWRGQLEGGYQFFAEGRPG